MGGGIEVLGPERRRRWSVAEVQIVERTYEPGGESAENEQLMRLIDEQYLSTPWYGSRQITRHLRRQGHWVNRKRVQRLMRLMGLSALGPRPRTSAPAPGHTLYPYLLRDLSICQPNQVWSTDVTYIPMARGFLYLVAVMDWYSRRVLAWQLSNTLDSEFCVTALEQALQRHGQPEIFNSDQGVQFSSAEFTGMLKAHDICISMDGKGRWMDNVFIERLWRSLKYECVYLQAFESPREAQEKDGQWMTYYNLERPHSSLQDRTPEEAYRGIAPLIQAA